MKAVLDASGLVSLNSLLGANDTMFQCILPLMNSLIYDNTKNCLFVIRSLTYIPFCWHDQIPKIYRNVHIDNSLIFFLFFIRIHVWLIYFKHWCQRIITVFLFLYPCRWIWKLEKCLWTTWRYDKVIFFSRTIVSFIHMLITPYAVATPRNLLNANRSTYSTDHG